MQEFSVFEHTYEATQRRIQWGIQSVELAMMSCVCVELGQIHSKGCFGNPQ